MAARLARAPSYKGKIISTRSTYKVGMLRSNQESRFEINQLEVLLLYYLADSQKDLMYENSLWLKPNVEKYHSSHRMMIQLVSFS